MFKFSVIIPAYNFPNHLDCCLMALTRQTFKDFEVIVVDDWSKESLKVITDKYTDKLPLTYIRNEKEKDIWKAGQARNIGINLAKDHESTYFLFLDSHVALNPLAMEYYNEYSIRHPNTVIIGKYNWMPPMIIIPEDIEKRFKDFTERKLPLDPKNEDLGLICEDPRWTNTWIKKERQAPDENKGSQWGLGAWTGNVCYPKEAIMKIGGFLDILENHNGEDGCLGVAVERLGYWACFSDEVIGYHIWHNRPKDANKHTLDNIDFIDYVHLIGKFWKFNDSERNLIKEDVRRVANGEQPLELNKSERQNPWSLHLQNPKLLLERIEIFENSTSPYVFNYKNIWHPVS